MRIVKNNIKLILLIILSITINIDYVFAYDFENQANAYEVNDMITEIYDAKQQYEDLAGIYEETEDEIEVVFNNLYWWPIGSRETAKVGNKLYAKNDPETVNITSKYGYRNDPFSGKKVLHSGLDISNGQAAGVVNVIAAQSGTVVYPGANDKIDCPTSNTLSNCGGGYGNHVIIQHVDGNYTLYGHLDANSITVKSGDAVEQGQVIGKMGSSGNSTAPHLHFEVRMGQNAYSATVDPLTYISATNPRNMLSISDSSNLENSENPENPDIFIKWLMDREGTRKTDQGYKVHSASDGKRTVGYGITLEANAWRFEKYGYNVKNKTFGDILPFDIVDKVFNDRVNDDRNYIKNQLAKGGVTGLKQNQIDALLSQKYNIGNIVGFTTAYKKYGDTEALFKNYILRAYKFGKSRRYVEWYMFHNNVYIFRKDVGKYDFPK